MKRKKKKRVDKGTPKWMATYADMVTLVLVFFILLFSMSQVNLVKFEALADSFRNEKVLDHYPSIVPMDHPTQSSRAMNEKEFNEAMFEENAEESEQEKVTDQKDSDLDREDSLDELLKEVNAFLKENNLTNMIEASRTDSGVVLVLKESVLFHSGEVEILGAGKPFLDKVKTLLVHIPNHIRVEGHTDNRPISSYRFPSNWELSAARASSVVRYLTAESNLEEERFSAIGYSDTRPIAPNNSPENLSENRRVEIVILEKNREN